MWADCSSMKSLGGSSTLDCSEVHTDYSAASYNYAHDGLAPWLMT